MSTPDPLELAACLRIVPPERYADNLAAAIMAAGLMRTNLVFHGAVRVLRWRTKMDAREAWLLLFTRVPGSASAMLGGTAEHCERGGFDARELLQLNDELTRVYRAMGGVQ